MSLPTLNTEGFLITQIAAEWFLSSRDFGEGFVAAQLTDLPEGRRSWSLRVDVLPGDNQGGRLPNDLQAGWVLREGSTGGYVLAENGARLLVERSATRAGYLWTFFRLSKANGDRPFWIEFEDPETGTRTNYLANFVADQLSYQVLCAQVYSSGLELLERRLPAAPVTQKEGKQ